MIITGVYNILLILNDKYLSTVKEIDHKYAYLYCGIYYQEREIIYLGLRDNLLEFD